jgi:hypothetical protein
MSKAFQLGFVEFGTQRIEPELRYYTEVIGATVTESEPDGSVYLGLGLDQHNIALRSSTQTGMRCIGFQVTKDIAIADWAVHIKNFGLSPVVKSDARPGVSKLVEVVEPGGHVLQLYSEMSVPAPGFASRASCPTNWVTWPSCLPKLRNRRSSLKTCFVSRLQIELIRERRFSPAIATITS